MPGTFVVSSLPLLLGATAVAGPSLQPLVAGAPPLTASAGAETAKAFEAASSHSQWLTSLALLVIGGSMLVLLHRDYVRPGTRLGRAFFLLFIAGWTFLTLSIWKGARAQQVYLAFLMSPPHGATRLASLHTNMNSDLGNQILFLQRGLAAFGMWLLAYLIWWLAGGDLRDGARAAASPVTAHKQTRLLGVAVLCATMGALGVPARAAAECDCDHYPYQPDPPCDKVCSARVFSNSTEADLMVLGIDRPLAHAIVEARQGNHSNHALLLADLQPAEQQELKAALERARPAVLHFLASPLAEKPHLAARLGETLHQPEQRAINQIDVTIGAQTTAHGSQAIGLSSRPSLPRRAFHRTTGTSRQSGTAARGSGMQSQQQQHRSTGTSGHSGTAAPGSGQPAQFQQQQQHQTYRPPATAGSKPAPKPAKPAPAAPPAQAPPPLSL
jgi:hypothetical protein